MRSETRAGWVMAVAVTVGLWGVADAAACSCAPRPDPVTALAQSDAVFVGTVTAIDRPDMPRWFYELLNEVDRRLATTFLPDDWDVTAVLSVDASWKGMATTRARVQTGSGGGDCGVPFREGDKYLIYATTWKDDFYTSICTRTASHARATEDLAYLAGIGQLSLAAPAPMPRLVVGISLLLVAGSCLAALRLRGRG